MSAWSYVGFKNINIIVESNIMLLLFWNSSLLNVFCKIASIIRDEFELLLSFFFKRLFLACLTFSDSFQRLTSLEPADLLSLEENKFKNI